MLVMERVAAKFGDNIRRRRRRRRRRREEGHAALKNG
jgi:hypothetical protein